jgi:hypothetical protein
MNELEEYYNLLKQQFPSGPMKGNTLLTMKNIKDYILNFKRTDDMESDFAEFDKFFYGKDTYEQWCDEWQLYSILDDKEIYEQIFHEFRSCFHKIWKSLPKN